MVPSKSKSPMCKNLGLEHSCSNWWKNELVFYFSWCNSCNNFLLKNYIFFPENENKRYGDEELCPTIQQRELDCNTDFSLTVWAYSPEGKEGERLTTSVKTQPCNTTP